MMTLKEWVENMGASNKGVVTDDSNVPEVSSVYHFDPDNYFITETIGYHNTFNTKPELWYLIRKQPMVMIFLSILVVEAIVLLIAYPITSIILLSVVIGFTVVGIFNEHYLMKRYYHKVIKIHSVNNINSKTLYRVYNYVPKRSKSAFLARVVDLSYKLYRNEIEPISVENWLSYIESILILHPTANIDYNGSLESVENLYEALTAQQWYEQKPAKKTVTDSNEVLGSPAGENTLWRKAENSAENVFPEYEKDWVGAKE